MLLTLWNGQNPTVYVDLSDPESPVDDHYGPAHSNQ
jgi:hypothetical protein